MALESEPETRPTLYMIAGPNGAGKSTLYAHRISPITSAPFINADVIQRDAADVGERIDAYEAARRAQHQRSRLMDEGRSFITETVFSHPSKLELIRQAKRQGYRIELYHINVECPEICITRVKARVADGGHDVPDDKIRQRYERNQGYIANAARLSDVAVIYDSSKAYAPPRWVLTMRDGVVDTAEASLPEWAKRLYGT